MASDVARLFKMGAPGWGHTKMENWRSWIRFGDPKLPLVGFDTYVSTVWHWMSTNSGHKNKSHKFTISLALLALTI